jgi:hypothetical protein
MPNPVNRDINTKKKPYSCPIITVYGTVKELTRTVGITGNRDGGSFASYRTHA